MKKIAASLGLIACGAYTFQAVSAPASTGSAKPFSASLGLRGFYDDNIDTAPDGEESFGWTVNPQIGLSYSGDQTSAAINYSYSARYYDHRPIGSDSNWDQTQIIDASLTHQFSPRYGLSVVDSFAIGQEPDVLRAGNIYDTFQRISGDNLRNFGGIIFNAELTKLLGLEIGYDNTWFNYADDGETFTVSPVGVIPSNSGILDRMEHAIHLDSRWHIKPQTTLVAGFQFRQICYTADEIIVFSPPTVLMSPVRNSQGYYGYGGIEQTFNPRLSGYIRGGASYVDYYNDPTTSANWNPYGAAALTYLYGPESTFQIGFNYDYGASDIVGGVDFVKAQDSGIIYGSIVHRIMPRLFGTLLASYQRTTFYGGGPGLDGEHQYFFVLGVDLEYRFNEHFSADIGYGFDNFASDLPGQGYDRNRAYVGVRAAY